MPGTSKKISDLDAIVTMHDNDLVEVSNNNSGTYSSVKATIGDVAEHVAKTTEFTNDLDTTDKTLVGAINEVAGDIPTVNDATLSIQVNSTEIGSFTANASSNETIDITVPTTVAELTDASDYATVASLATVATTGSYNDLSSKPTIPPAQVQADWDQSDNTQVDYIKNKPTIPSAQVNADWNSVSGVSEILNKPTLATVATSGLYADLLNTPTIPEGLADLTDDVNISSPSDGQILKYDGSSSKWVNGTGGGGGASALDDLTDVNITSATLANGQVLKYDSANSEWVNGTGGSAGYQELTYDQYQALSPAQKTDGTMYFLTDVNGDGSQFQPVIYSETEREIGVWKDGKPLYEKTLSIPTLVSGTYTTVPHNIDDIDYIFIHNAVTQFVVNSNIIYGTSMPYASSPSSEQFCVDINTNADSVGYVCGTALAGGSAIVILRYTKTTDTAGSGTWTPQGVPARHYSTSEQVVGTWIDGNTLYEKTVTFSATSGTNFDYTLDIVGLDSTTIMYIADGFFLCGVNRRGLNFYLTNAYNAFTNVDFNSNDNKYHIGGCITGYSGNGYVTVRYTKTSS